MGIYASGGRLYSQAKMTIVLDYFPNGGKGQVAVKMMVTTLISTAFHLMMCVLVIKCGTQAIRSNRK